MTSNAIAVCSIDPGLNDQDVDDIDTELRRDFAVTYAPSPERGGPDYIPLILYMAYETVRVLGPNLAASALWDGLKLWLRRRQPVPSHYSPGTYVLPSVEFEIQDRGFHCTMVARTDDPATLRQALTTLSSTVERLHQRQSKPPGQFTAAYDPEDGQWDIHE